MCVCISSSNGNLNNYQSVYTCTIIIKVCIVYKHEHKFIKYVYRSGGLSYFIRNFSNHSSLIFSLSLLLWLC